MATFIVRLSFCLTAKRSWEFYTQNGSRVCYENRVVITLTTAISSALGHH